LKKAAIIGSGIAGIGSALRLAAKGYDVTVYEQAAIPGGKISQIRDKSFRFDTGPSLFTLPNQVDELFELFGEKPEDHFRYNKLNTSCKYFWDDGTIVNAWQDTGKFAREVEQATGVPQKNILGFLKKSRKLYDVTAEIFMFNSLHKLKNFTTPNFRKSLLQVHELDAFTSMHKKNTQWFSHPKIVQLFDRYATYNGSDPYQTPATLNIIAHLEHNIGAFFPEKGMYSIVESLVKLAENKGVKFIYKTPVQKIIVEGKRIRALKIDDTVKNFDLVISNVDVDTLYRKLLPDHKPHAPLLKTQRSTSALIFYWGINKSFPELEVHNILFSDDYRQEFRHLFESKTISNDPTVYLFVSSKTVKGDAPEGSENWYVMINVPENVGQDWDALIADARRHIIDRINRVLKTDIEKHILFEHRADPKTIETNTGSFGGSLYGPSSNNRFAAFLRHPNFKRKFRNLYFTGGSVHPGGGIPLCLASAKIVGNEIPAV
jgi:phytoene desaturase